MSIAAKVSKNLRKIAEGVDMALLRLSGGKRIAFTIVVYTEGRANYISTATREDNLREFKTIIQHWEDFASPDVPLHKVN